MTGHKAEIEYWEQRYYRSIALRYDEKGRRKEMVVLGSSRGVGANILGLGKGMEMKKIKSDRKNEEDENNKDIEKKHRRRVIKLTK